MKEEHLLLLSGIWKFINQVVLIDYIIIIQGGDSMTGADILVIIMGVIAVGIGIYCFFTEHFSSGKSDSEQKEIKGGDGQ